MKKTIIIVLLLVGCLVWVIVFNHRESRKETKADCDVFQNNPYKIIFHSDGGPEVETIEICEDCERKEDNTLPIIAKKGYNFEGWYYDSTHLMKANVNTIDELDISIERNNEGCDYKYKDINLYALWTKK